MTRVIPFILYLLLIAMHEVIVRDATTIYSAAIDLPGLLVLVVAIYKPEIVCTWFGFAAGLVLAAGRPDLFGWHALAMAALALATYHFRERLNLESFYSKLVLILGGVLLHGTLGLAINGGAGFLYLWLVSVLPSAVYTTAVGWVFFLFIEKKITFQKVKAVF